MADDLFNSFMNGPDENGRFGIFGGRFVSETLMAPLQELREAYEKYLQDPEFLAELDADLAHYVGRPSPVYHAERWSREIGGAQLYLKRSKWAKAMFGGSDHHYGRVASLGGL